MRPLSREAALAAVREWQAIHGRPPDYREWETATADHAASKTIQRRWGWKRLIAEATGIAPDEVPDGRQRRDPARREVMLQALLAVSDQLGCLPKGNEWERAGWLPSRRTYVRTFGSWAQACAAAEQMAENSSSTSATSGRAPALESHQLRCCVDDDRDQSEPCSQVP